MYVWLPWPAYAPNCTCSNLMCHCYYASKYWALVLYPKYPKAQQGFRIRPYIETSTPSRPIREVKPQLALLVVRWVTTGEHGGVVSIFCFCFAQSITSTTHHDQRIPTNDSIRLPAFALVGEDRLGTLLALASWRRSNWHSACFGLLQPA